MKIKLTKPLSFVMIIYPFSFVTIHNIVKKSKNWFFTLLVFFISNFYFASNYTGGLSYTDEIYLKNIATVQLRETSFELSSPIIELNSGQQLILSFDDFNGGFQNYTYTLVHCDAEWAPSDLQPNEYLNGFFEDNISNYSYSLNTLQKYTHYELKFPTTNMNFSKSGNYVVWVYENGDKNKPVLSKRFMVVQPLVSIIGHVHQAARSDEYFDKQEIDFSVFYHSLKVINPFQDFRVVITQNNRWDHAITKLKPMFSKPGELTYDYDDGSNCFNGGNEFRSFDNKSLKFLTPFVLHQYKDSLNQNHTILFPDQLKTFKRYMFSQDINGEFFIRNTEMDRSEIEADYSWVNFFFPYEEAIEEGSFYVAGEFCDWKTTKINAFVYNSVKKGYELQLYLKQGFYNYQLVYKQNEYSQLDETMLEGNHWETENDYGIFVYYREIGNYYDQLVGVRKLNSVRKNN